MLSSGIWEVTCELEEGEIAMAIKPMNANRAMHCVIIDPKTKASSAAKKDDQKFFMTDRDVCLVNVA